jgi:hypothetical protein
VADGSSQPCFSPSQARSARTSSSSCAFLAPIWLTTTSIACFLSRFETCARSDTFTPATHASLNQILYSTLLQASPSALPSSSHSLPRTASPNWPTFKLSDVQRDARKLDVKGKGKERYVGEAGTAGEKGQVGVGDLDKMGWRKDRCERAFERGDLVYRIKCVSPLLLFQSQEDNPDTPGSFGLLVCLLFELET